MSNRKRCADCRKIVASDGWYEQEDGSWIDEGCQQKRIARVLLSDELAALREGLEFYAERSNYKSPRSFLSAEPVLTDQGRRARAILAATATEPSPKARRKLEPQSCHPFAPADHECDETGLIEPLAGEAVATTWECANCGRTIVAGVPADTDTLFCPSAGGGHCVMAPATDQQQPEDAAE
jgi:hypothetical protein